MKKYWFFLAFCCIHNVVIAASKTNATFKTASADPVKRIVREIAKSNVFELPASHTLQNARYLQLSETASVDELIKIATKNKNAVVRLYAYQAIVQKLTEVPPDIFEQFDHDTSIVATLRGNIPGRSTVNKIAASFLY